MAPRKPQLDLQQVEKAVVALQRYVGAQKSGEHELLEDEDDFLYLMLSLKTSHPNHRSDKPIRIPLPHPLYDFENAEICLFVKDSKAGDGHKSAKRRLAQYEKQAGVSKVIGTSKLRTKYESHEAKRNLCRQYDLFLADERILPSLPKLIGKSFFKKKKQPIPIRLSVKDWEGQLARARSCTPLILSGGSCVSLKVARVSFSQEEILENVQAALEASTQHIPKKWSNVQAVFVKTADSLALPVFQTLPDQSRKI